MTTADFHPSLDCGDLFTNIWTHLDNVLPYFVLVLVCGHAGVHLYPREQNKLASEIFVDVTIHLLKKEEQEE